MRYLFILLLFCSNVFGTTTTITSLPFTFGPDDRSSDVDTLVLNGTKLSSATNGIYFYSEYADPLRDVVLNLGTDTLEFGTTGGDSNYGIQLFSLSNANCTNIKIVGGFILHNPSDTTADENICLNITGDSILVKDVTATIRGYNGIVLYSSGSTVHSNILSGGTFKSEVSGFTNRCHFDAPVVKLDHLYATTLTTNGASTHWVVDGLTIAGGPHIGIVAAGYTETEYGMVEIKNCDIMTDARNEFYLENSGLCFSTSNPYAILTNHLGGGSLIYNNTITSGTTYGGNRGINIEGSQKCTAENPMIVRKNNINVHEGPNVEYGEGLPLHGLRIRYGVGNIIVDSNTFIGTGDSDAGTKHTGSQVHVVRISLYTPWDSANVQITNNRIRAIALDTGVDNCNAIIYDHIDSSYVVNLSYNNITSSGHVYQFGSTNSVGSKGNLIIGDTVGFESLTLEDSATYSLGYLSNNWDCSGNIARDVVYTGGTSATDIIFSLAGTLDMTIQKTLRIFIMGNNDSLVDGASLTLKNNYNQTLINNSNVHGQDSAIASYWYESRTATDSTNYNTFDITASKDGENKDTSITVNWDTGDMYIPLNLAGTIDTSSGNVYRNRIRGNVVIKNGVVLK